LRSQYSGPRSHDVPFATPYSVVAGFNSHSIPHIRAHGHADGDTNVRPPHPIPHIHAHGHADSHTNVRPPHPSAADRHPHTAATSDITSEASTNQTAANPDTATDEHTQ
jgi:hypothetical protein